MIKETKVGLKILVGINGQESLLINSDRINAYVIKGEILNHLLVPLGQGAIGNKHSLTSTMDWYTYNEFMEKHATNSNLPHEQWSALYENYVGISEWKIMG